MKTVVTISLMCFNTILLSQDFFPYDSLKSIYVKTDYEIYSIHNYHVFGTTFTNTFSIPKVQKNGKEYYLLNFESSTYLFRFNQQSNTLYIYIPSKDSEFVAINFNLPLNAEDTTYISGEKCSYKCTKKEIISILGKPRYKYSYSVNSIYEKTFDFTEGFGLTYRYKVYPSYYPSYYKSYFESAIYDSFYYRPITIKLDSTSIQSDRYKDMFPFVMKIYGSSSNQYHTSDFNVNVNLIRNDSVLFSNVYQVNKSLWTANIEISEEQVLPDDIISYKIQYKDTSIFFSDVTFPDTGYYSFKVLDSPTGNISNISFPEEFRLFDPYPNPFNPNTTIKYQLKSTENVTLKIFDLLGREIATLIEEEKAAGTHSYTLFADKHNLKSGVYFCQLRAGGFLQTKKIILMK